MAALALVVRLPLYYLFGLYQAPSAFRLAGKPGWWGPAVYFARALLASAAGSLVLGGLMLGLFGLRVFPGFPRLVLAYEAGFALAALLLTRLVFALISLRAPANPETIHWRPSITRGVLFAAPLAVTLLVYMSASLWYFGTPMPVSGQIKRWWGTLPNPIYGKPAATVGDLLTVTGKIKPWGLVERIVSWPKKPFPDALRLGGYALLGGYLVYKQRKRVLRALQEMSLLPLFTGAYIHIISYTGTGYIHMRSWYWTAQMMLVTLVFGIFLDALLETLAGWGRARAARRAQPARGIERVLRRPQQVFAALLGAVFVLYCAADILLAMPLFIPAENEQAYLSGIQQMEDATEPGSIVGSTGGGGIAYFVKDRVIVNLDGLMNSTEYYHMLQNGTAREYLDRIGMRYVYTGAMVINNSDPYFQFKGRLERIREFPGITLFRWLPGK